MNATFHHHKYLVLFMEIENSDAMDVDILLKGHKIYLLSSVSKNLKKDCMSQRINCCLDQLLEGFTK